MRLWVIISCLLIISCAEQVAEKSPGAETGDSTASPVSAAVDSSAGFAKDSPSHASYVAPPIKKPSGIYQLLLPQEGNTRILHTIAFYPNSFRLEEEYQNKTDSVVVTEGTWAPSRGFIWLYKEQLVRGRYVWKGDTLQYFSPKLNKKFSMTKLIPAGSNPAFQAMKKAGAVLYGIGTEPFWSVEVKRQDSLVVSMPDWTQPLRVRYTGLVKEKKGTTYSAPADSVQVTILPFFCNDGMSDFIYTHKLILQYKGQTFNGCGFVF